MIAIIAILAALLLPVFATARERARRASCQSNLHDIYQALELYRKDTLSFPPGLWDAGYGTTANANVHQPGVFDPNGNYHLLSGAPANVPVAGLRILLGVADANNNIVVPQYMTSWSSFHCLDNPDGKTNDPSTTTYVGYDNYLAPDEFGLSQNPAAGSTAERQSVQTYGLTRFDPANAAAATDPDFTRQLYLKQPDDTTVVTWCIEHRPLVGSVHTPKAGQKDDIFLYLDGHTRVGLYAGFLNSGNCQPPHNAYTNGLDDQTCP